MTSTAATPTHAAPSDDSDALIDVERTAQVVGHPLPLLRELKRRADAAATPEHNRRILNGPLQTSEQDANNETDETSPQAGRNSGNRNEIDISTGAERRPMPFLDHALEHHLAVLAIRPLINRRSDIDERTVPRD